MRSVWTEGLPADRRPTLAGRALADVVIVGQGLTGVTTAYELSRLGKKVVVLEQDGLHASATARTTAFITYVIDTDLTELVKIFGLLKARQVWQSGQAAIDGIENNVRRENIDCEFTRCDEYQFALSDEDWLNLQKEVRQAREFNFPLELRRAGLPFANHGFAVIPRQPKFHPLKYLLGLRAAAESRGAKFYENSAVEKIEGEQAVTVKTKRGAVTASHLVIATHDPFNHPRELFARKGPYVSYVLGGLVESGVLAEGLYLDRANPYHYFRLDPQSPRDRLILGGADHRRELKIDPEKNFKALRDYWQSLLPGLTYEITHRWSGPIMEPLDGLPSIGRYSRAYPNHYAATGYSGNGLTYSWVAACIIRDLISSRPNAWTELYDPRRIPTFNQLWAKGRDYTAEFFGGAVKNYFR